MTRPRIALLGAILLAAAACACAPGETSPPVAAAAAVDTAAVMVGLADVWDRWATADTAENLDAIVGLMTEDGRMDAKGFPPMIGREAARAAMAQLYGQVDYLEASASPSITVAITNDVAHQAGTYLERYTMKGQKGEMTDYGRYAAAFTKGADARWRWTYMIVMVDSTVTKK
jgi:ketosteroid isomerase-like protein